MSVEETVSLENEKLIGINTELEVFCFKNKDNFINLEISKRIAKRYDQKGWAIAGVFKI